MPPVVIAGAIAGAGAIGSAVIGSNAAKSAAKLSQQSADQSAQLQRETYQQNAATLAPYVQSGNQATGAINSLLGLGGQSQSTPQPTQQQMGAEPYSFGGGFSGIRDGFGTALQQMQARQNVGQPQQQASYLTPTQAFDNYRNSTGYQFRFDQGMNALNSGYAGAGTIKSGAAIKAGMEFGQNIASGEFNNYLGALGNQQGVGLSAASAQAGVGQNYANNLTNINANNAANQGNAGFAGANATGQALNSLATIGAGLFNQPNTYSRLAPSAASTIASNPGIF